MKIGCFDTVLESDGIEDKASAGLKNIYKFIYQGGDVIRIVPVIT